MDYTNITEQLRMLDPIIDGLDPGKSFDAYRGFRELGFVMAHMLEFDIEDNIELIFFMSKLGSDLLMFDPALTNNLYHYLNTKFDENRSDDEKEYLIKHIDKYIKPNSNKTNPSINRFCAGYLTYKMAYEGDFTSKNEARCLLHIIYF